MMKRHTVDARRGLKAVRAISLLVTTVALGLAEGASPAHAAVSPSILEFGDVPWGTDGTPIQRVSINGGGAEIKSVFGRPRFQIVENDCGSFDKTACTIGVAPVHPASGDAMPGRVTDSLVVGYTDGTSDYIFASANFLPEPPPLPPSTWLAIGDVTVVEGNSGTQAATFTVNRYGTTTGTSSVKWATANATAVAGSDYASVPPTTLSFAEGETAKTVAVNVNGDTVDEGNETFSVHLSAPTGATLADDNGTGTITDNDQTYLSVTDTTLTEGNSGTRVAAFRVTRSGSITAASTVKWATANGTAAAASDYAAVPLTTLSFAAGETFKTVSVTVNGDRLNEANETFTVRLSAPTGAVVSDDTGLATITDDDASYLTIGDLSVTEGNSGSIAATLTVKRFGSTAGAASVRWNTASGTATGGSDYVGVSPTTLSFLAGETTKTLSVNINGDTVDELNEAFLVRLSSPIGAVISDGTATVTIVDDDGSITAGPRTHVSIRDVSVAEGNTGTKTAVFTVARSGVTSGASSVEWQTVDGTASAGSDYVAVPLTTLSFAAGETSKAVSVTVNADAIDEANETFSVRLSAPSGAVIADDAGVGTITDDDTAYLTIQDVSVTEGNTGTRTARVVVRRAGSTAGPSTVKWGTANSTATAGSDYAAVPLTTLSFAAGETTKTLLVPVNGDPQDEADEAFTVVLSAPTAVTPWDTRAVVTIVDDDATYLTVTNVTVPEGDSGTSVAAFALTRSGATAGTSTVRWAVAGGSATSGTDYVDVPLTTVSFGSGETSKALPVTINGDTVDEANETFSLFLSAPTGATLSDGGASGVIVDEDPTTTLVVNDVLSYVEEAGVPAEFTITRAGDTSGSSSVQYMTADETAVAGGDYEAIPLTTVTFAGGETTKRVPVTIINDTTDEEVETFLLQLSSPTGATILDGTGQAKLWDMSPG